MIAAILAALGRLFGRPNSPEIPGSSQPAEKSAGWPALAPPDLIRATIDRLWFDHRVPNGKAAYALLYAIGMQESRFKHRDQVVPGKAPGQVGPATGFWQFERGGGVAGVMQHHLSADIARKAVEAAGVPWEPGAVWNALAHPEYDRLAATFARLLLFTDARPLPPATPEAEEEAWQYYLRNWRPGKPHRATWGEFWRKAIA